MRRSAELCKFQELDSHIIHNLDIYSQIEWSDLCNLSVSPFVFTDQGLFSSD